MTDFDWEVKQRRDLVRASRGAIRGRKKNFSVSLPHDRMTRKELKRMNGDVRVWTPGSDSPTFPIAWNVFKQMSAENQSGYLRFMQETYKVPMRAIADMFGVCEATLSMQSKELDYVPLRKKKYDAEAWERFLNGTTEEPAEEVAEEIAVEPVVEELAVEEPVAEEVPEVAPVEETTVEVLDTARLAELLKLLKGTGAKVTIEVTL